MGELFSIEKSRRSREFSPENPSFSQAGCWIDAKSVCNRVEDFNTEGKRETLPWRLIRRSKNLVKSVSAQFFTRERCAKTGKRDRNRKIELNQIVALLP